MVIDLVCRMTIDEIPQLILKCSYVLVLCRTDYFLKEQDHHEEAIVIVEDSGSGIHFVGITE